MDNPIQIEQPLKGTSNDINNLSYLSIKSTFLHQLFQITYTPIRIVFFLSWIATVLLYEITQKV